MNLNQRLKEISGKFLSDLIMMIPTMILIGILIGLMYLLNPFINKELNDEIRRLKKENKELVKKNELIFKSINSLELLKIESDKKISMYEQEQEQQKKRIIELNNQLYKLKNKYEKANNHSANFSSADIRRYFADSLDR